MKIDEDPVRAISEWSLLRLAYLYAQAIDRNDPKLLGSLFTPDGIFERPDAPAKNLKDICAMPTVLAETYASTMHTVLNQAMDVRNDTASGETYCIAYHILKGQGGTTLSLNKALRYQDECLRTDGTWRFRSRRMVYVWTEVRQVTSGGMSLIS